MITETPREGWAVATDAGETLALDLELTPELVRRGLAREVVRLVQEGRKSAGLDVSDRIELWLSAAAGSELAGALAEHAGRDRRRGPGHARRAGRRPGRRALRGTTRTWV